MTAAVASTVAGSLVAAVVTVTAAGTSGLVVVVAVVGAEAVDAARAPVLVSGVSQGGKFQTWQSAGSVLASRSLSQPHPTELALGSIWFPIGPPDHEDPGLGWGGRHVACWYGYPVLVQWRWTMPGSGVNWGSPPSARLSQGLSLCWCCQRAVLASVVVPVAVAVAASAAVAGTAAVVVAVAVAVTVGGADADAVAGSGAASVIVAGPVAVAVVVIAGEVRA